jgi:hypothetical protein
MSEGRRVYLFTLEAVGKCQPFEAEYFLRVAADALHRAGFALDDAQAIGIDGAPGAAIDFPDPKAVVLTDGREPDDRRMATVPSRMR